jgi:hypothetical protein
MKNIIVLQTLEDAQAFLLEVKHRKGRSLANFLKLKGRDSTKLADDILNYAHNLRCVYNAPNDASARVYAHACDLCVNRILQSKAAYQVAVMINTNHFESYLK